MPEEGKKQQPYFEWVTIPPPTCEADRTELYKHILKTKEIQLQHYFDLQSKTTESTRAWALEGYKAYLQWNSVANQGAIQISQIGLRAVVIVNGGAAVALLAFLGHVFGASRGNVSGIFVDQITAALMT